MKLAIALIAQLALGASVQPAPPVSPRPPAVANPPSIKPQSGKPTHGASQAPPSGQPSNAHPAAPIGGVGSTRGPSSRPPRAPQQCNPPGCPNGFAPNGPYVGGSGFGDPYGGYGYYDDTTINPAPVEPWDVPVDATDGWSQPSAPDQSPLPEPPPAPAQPAQPDDNCRQTEDWQILDADGGPVVYRWVDAAGDTHYSDFALIPPEYRRAAVPTSGEPIMITHPHIECGPPPAASDQEPAPEQLPEK